jgi:hypothetical protein
MSRSKFTTVFSRVPLVLLSLLFAACLHLAHRDYLNPVLEVWGFPFEPGDWATACWGAIAVSVVALTLPVSVRRPSAVVLAILFMLVFVPTVVVTLGTRSDALTRYGLSLAALTLSFVTLNLASRGTARVSSTPRGVPHEFEIFVFCIWLALFVFIAVAYRDVVSFVGLDNIYDQRAAGRSRNAVEAYAQTYLGYVFSPALLALGLVNGRGVQIWPALAGFLLMYGVTAERTVFVLPLVMVLIWVALRRGTSAVKLVAFALVLLSAACVLPSMTFAADNALAGLISLYVVFRTVAVPGAMFWQYHDVFAGSGHTWWSNVKGVAAFVEVPGAFQGNPNWPQLGYIVAEEVQGLDSNSNANLFAYDGLAAAGAPGVLVVSFAFGIWLLLLDRLARRIDPRFTILVCTPMAFTLTNGSLPTILLSFGGLFWLFAFGWLSRSHRRVL